MDYSLDLFKPLTRDQRQELGRQTWIKNKCRGTLVYPTGVGSGISYRVLYIKIPKGY